MPSKSSNLRYLGIRMKENRSCAAGRAYQRSIAIQGNANLQQTYLSDAPSVSHGCPNIPKQASKEEFGSCIADVKSMLTSACIATIRTGMLLSVSNPFTQSKMVHKQPPHACKATSTSKTALRTGGRAGSRYREQQQPIMLTLHVLG